MCGFAGFTGEIQNKDEIIKKMTSRIVHRGPDMGGHYCSDGIALGFRRLSILDLRETGNQPVSNEETGISLVYNGEIYNYQEIKEELIAKGYSFKSNCDTEVLFYSYCEYGESVVNRLRGMFAFAIYDERKKTLFCARDHFGIKPFYYGLLDDGTFIFGSEIKSFLDHPSFEKKVNENVLLPYLTFQYSPANETFFQGIYKLPPAHTLVFKDGKINIREYWDINFKPHHTDIEKCAENLDKTINESVSAHKISDLEVGCFLSGGIDSSYITSALRPDKTFSVGFGDSGFNETVYAEELSEILGIEHYTRILKPDECFEAFPDIQYHLDEPQSNPSVVPLYFLSKLAREHVAVVLSGEGADEIFAGYDWYDQTPMMKKYKRLPAGLRRCTAKIAKALPYFKGRDFLIRSSGVPEDYFIGQAMIFERKEALDILKPNFRHGIKPEEITRPHYEKVKHADELTKKQYLDLKQWLPGDILLKADKMSMAFSLELRVPFLDKEVMKFAEGIPSEYRINGETTKYILRKASSRTLPEEWVNRKKMGFPVPIRLWLRKNKYYSIVKKYFEADFAGIFFDKNKINAILEDHYTGKSNNARKIWTIFTFLTWYKRFFIDESNV